MKRFELNVEKDLVMYFHNQPHLISVNTNPLQDNHVLNIVQSFNQFFPGHEWKQIIDKKIWVLYKYLPITIRVWEYACETGTILVVNHFIRSGFKQWESGFSLACMNQRDNVMELLFRTFVGTESMSDLVNQNKFRMLVLNALAKASSKNVLQVVEPILQEFIDNYLTCSSSNVTPECKQQFCDLLYSATLGGDSRLIRHVVQTATKFFNRYGTGPDHGAVSFGTGPDHGEHNKLYDFDDHPVPATNDHVDFWNHGLIGASEKGNLSCVQFMVMKGATDIRAALIKSLSMGHEDVSMLLLGKMATSSSS